MRLSIDLSWCLACCHCFSSRLSSPAHQAWLLTHHVHTLTYLAGRKWLGCFPNHFLLLLWRLGKAPPPAAAFQIAAVMIAGGQRSRQALLKVKVTVESQTGVGTFYDCSATIGYKIWWRGWRKNGVFWWPSKTCHLKMKKHKVRRKHVFEAAGYLALYWIDLKNLDERLEAVFFFFTYLLIITVQVQLARVKRLIGHK